MAYTATAELAGTERNGDVTVTVTVRADDGLAYRMRGPKHVEGAVQERRPYRGGTIEVVPLIPNRPRVRPAVAFRAIPERAEKPARTFGSEADARRWIEENEVGGNPNGFLHELAGRRWRRR